MRINLINAMYKPISFGKQNKLNNNNTEKTVPTTLPSHDATFKSSTNRGRATTYMSQRELDAYVAERVYTI